ncbi:MAG TPA: MMPL family transporter [Pseudonocardiaceae bacterium]|nr:MMPL family transporter [Pseudonocardiaceae bacterium]
MVALLTLLAGAAFALLLQSPFPAGGYTAPGSQSAQADNILQGHFNASGMPVIFEVTAVGGIDSPAARARGEQIVRALNASGQAGQVVAYWNLPPGTARSALRSDDGKSAVVTALISGGDSYAPGRANTIAQPLVGDRNGVDVKVGGQAIVYYEDFQTILKNAETLEFVVVPITLLVLIWVFGSAVAALLPLVIAVFSSVCAVALLRILAEFTDVTIYTLSVASPLCLALAIDYTLFIINRYREELATGSSRDEALKKTLRTTGRTVTYSALTVGLSMAAMTVFPMYFLRSIGYAGLISVALSAFGALVIAPALIVVLGPRIDAWDVRKPIRRWLGKPPPRLVQPAESFWYRLSRVTMRFALPITLVLVAVFVFIASPFLSVRFSLPDDRVLPQSSSARQVGDDLRSGFSQDNTSEVQVVLPNVAGASAARLADYGSALATVPGVVSVSGPAGTYVGGRQVSTQTGFGGLSDGVGYYVVDSTVDPLSTAASNQLRLLRQVSAPSAVLFTGIAQQYLDNVDGVTSQVPLVLILIALSSFVLLFLFTGSVVLPLKALVMNFLSLSAAFGAMVWIFQDGHLGGLGTTAVGSVNISIPPLIFCIAFGLSMDYEVFMLSRIREEWLRTGRTAADNPRAVAMGLGRTGRLITTAALLMIIVFVALTAVSQVSFVRMLGAGLTITIVLDAVLIRSLLVPAVMRLAGRFNWWAPRSWQRWQERYGLRDEPFVDEPVVEEPIAAESLLIESEETST